MDLTRHRWRFSSRLCRLRAARKKVVSAASQTSINRSRQQSLKSPGLAGFCPRNFVLGVSSRSASMKSKAGYVYTTKPQRHLQNIGAPATDLAARQQLHRKQRLEDDCDGETRHALALRTPPRCVLGPAFIRYSVISRRHKLALNSSLNTAF